MSRWYDHDTSQNSFAMVAAPDVAPSRGQVAPVADLNQVAAANVACPNRARREPSEFETPCSARLTGFSLFFSDRQPISGFTVERIKHDAPDVFWSAFIPLPLRMSPTFSPSNQRGQPQPGANPRRWRNSPKRGGKQDRPSNRARRSSPININRHIWSCNDVS